MDIQTEYTQSKANKTNFGCVCTAIFRLPAEISDEQMRHYGLCALYTIEKCLAYNRKHGCYQTCWIYDIENLRYSMIPKLSLNLKI